MLRKVITGGQTGVDRAALDTAIDFGLQYGGWIPAGRRAEDGPIPARYTHLAECDSADYSARTRRNVRDTDATLIICDRKLHGGTALTESVTLELNRPLLVIQLGESGADDAINRTCEWLNVAKPQVLNIAGPRASEWPDAYERVITFLGSVFRSIVIDPRRR